MNTYQLKFRAYGDGFFRIYITNSIIGKYPLSNLSGVRFNKVPLYETLEDDEVFVQTFIIKNKDVHQGFELDSTLFVYADVVETEN